MIQISWKTISYAGSVLVESLNKTKADYSHIFIIISTEVPHITTKTQPYQQVNLVFKIYFTRINKHHRESIRMAVQRPSKSDYNSTAMTCNLIGGHTALCVFHGWPRTSLWNLLLIHNTSAHWVMVLLLSITNNTTLRPRAQRVTSWHYSDMWIFNNLAKLTGGILASWGEKMG